MARLIVPIVIIAFMIFAIVDLLLTPPTRVRGVPKLVWAAIVILLPIVGGILWFWIGKESARSAEAPRMVHPDDDPTFLATIRRDEEQDERIRRLEQELADLDDDPPKEK
jgi:uncharacterized membrane protein